MKKVKLISICLVLLLLFSGCKSEANEEENVPTENPIVTMEIEDYGTVKIELYPKYAPNTVANFVNLIESGFYDNNSFHRLIPGFVLQGGDPKGNGYGGPGYTIKGEFKENNYNNTLKHTKGVISMARSQSNDSAGSQFFIVLDSNENVTYSLDDKYAAFGSVIEGMEIFKKIEKNEKIADEESGKLENNITIKKVTVDTKGYTYKVKKISEN